MFGLCFHRRAARRQKSTHAVPRLRFESLEARRLLATDIDVVQVSGITDGAVVAYEIHEEAAANFEITAYGSKDGVELGGVLDSVRVDSALAREVGEHVAALDWESHHVTEDHVVIVVDSASEVAETDEGNNYASFALPIAQDPSLEIVSVTDEGCGLFTLQMAVSQGQALSINWGDGEQESIIATEAEVEIQHIYLTPGSFEVNVVASDVDGDQTTASAVIVSKAWKPTIRDFDVSFDSRSQKWQVTGLVEDNENVTHLRVKIDVDGVSYFVETNENGRFYLAIVDVRSEVTAKVMDADDWWSDVVRWGRP